jgi:hypothetical protein
MTRKLSAKPCIGRVLVKRKKRGRKNKSNFKAMMIVPFDIRGIVRTDWVPEVQTVDQVYCKEVLTNLLEGVRRKYLKCGRTAHRFFTMTTRQHTTHGLSMFLAKHKIPVLRHPPYSPDLSPCDFFLFLKIKSALKATRFDSVDAVKAKATGVMKKISKINCSIVFNSGKFAWSGVGVGEGTTLKVMIFLLCD